MKLIVIMYKLSITVNKNLLLTPDYFLKKKMIEIDLVVFEKSPGFRIMRLNAVID